MVHRARSHWAEKEKPSPHIRHGRIRVPSPASPRLSLFFESETPILAFGRSLFQVLREALSGARTVRTARTAEYLL